MVDPSSPDPSSPERGSLDSVRPDEEETPSRPPIALPKGTRLREEYQVGRVLGMGSFGITYRARDLHLDTSVAIKEYYPRHLAGRTGDSLTVRPHSQQETETFQYGRERFREEGQMLARFDHSNIVQVHSYFKDHGTGYLVMEYYEGQTLAETLASRGGTIPEREAVQVIRHVLEGLQPVHKQGVLHRDIDPQNIYQTTAGQVVLIDFGAAREAIGERSQSLSTILKHGYAPYEQYYSDGEQGPWTDVYACAATLYTCLTGVRPPEAPQRLRNDELVSPREAGGDVSLDLSLTVMKGLAVEPDDRPASAAAFAEMLDESQRETGSTVRGTDGAAPAPHEADGQAPSSRAPSSVSENQDPEKRPSMGRLALFVATVVVLGLFVKGGDGASTSAFGYVGTWLVVSLGLVGLFREAGNAMTDESRAAVRDWLLQQDLATRGARWPSTFTSLFDALFTREHFSWICFKRSALVSVAMVLLLLVGVIGVGLIPVDVFVDLLRAEGNPAWYNFLLFLSWVIPFNIVGDYLSLLETRYVLGKMSRSNRSSAHLAYLGLDLVLTAAIFLGMVVLSQPLFFLLFREVSLFSLKGLQELLTGTRTAVLMMGHVLVHADLPPVILIYSTLFTSVWVWLYVGAGLAYRGLHPLLRSLDVLKRHFDVEARPVHTLGVLLAVIVTGFFAVSGPFVL